MKILFPFRPISINDMYYSNKKFGMKVTAKEWCYQVNWLLAEYSSQFDTLRQQFSETSHGLKIEIDFYYKDFLNAKGGISSKIYDLSNCEKLILDLVIDKAHHGKPPYKSPNLALNDKHVVELVSKKHQGESDYFEVAISIVDLGV